MPRVTCKGLCGRDFDRGPAIESGELLETDVCRSCYTRYALSPDECFGKGLADKTDRVCRQCIDYSICVNWRNNMPPKKAKEEEELDEELDQELEGEDEEEMEDLEEEEEESDDSEEEEEEEEKPAKKGKGKAAPAKEAKGKKTSKPAKKAKDEDEEEEEEEAPPKTTPFRPGSAKEKAFLMLKKGATKEELEKALKGMCSDPWMFVQAKLIRRTTGGDKSQSWKVKGPSPSGKYRLEITK